MYADDHPLSWVSHAGIESEQETNRVSERLSRPEFRRPANKRFVCMSACMCVCSSDRQADRWTDGRSEALTNVCTQLLVIQEPGSPVCSLARQRVPSRRPPTAMGDADFVTERGCHHCRRRRGCCCPGVEETHIHARSYREARTKEGREWETKRANQPAKNREID